MDRRHDGRVEAEAEAEAMSPIPRMPRAGVEHWGLGR